MSKVPLNHLLKIGAETLETTAQTLSGAINEVRTLAINALTNRVSWHKYNGVVEECTLNASDSWQSVTFHEVPLADLYVYKLKTNYAGVRLRSQSAASATVNSNYGYDLTYKVLCDHNNVKIRLLKTIPFS